MEKTVIKNEAAIPMAIRSLPIADDVQAQDQSHSPESQVASIQNPYVDTGSAHFDDFPVEQTFQARSSGINSSTKRLTR